MTESDASVISEEMVERAAARIALIEVCGTLDRCPPAGCECREMARAALEAAVPIAVAAAKERAAGIALKQAEEMDAMQMEYGGVGSGEPVAVRCQTRAVAARELADAIRADTGGRVSDEASQRFRSGAMRKDIRAVIRIWKGAG